MQLDDELPESYDGEPTVYVVQDEVHAAFQIAYADAMIHVLTISPAYTDSQALRTGLALGDRRIPWTQEAELCLEAVGHDFRFNHGQITYLKFCIFENNLGGL